MFVARNICYILPYITPSEMPLTDRLRVIHKSWTPTWRGRALALLQPVVETQWSKGSVQIRRAILKQLQSVIHITVQECRRLFDFRCHGLKGEGLLFSFFFLVVS